MTFSPPDPDTFVPPHRQRYGLRRAVTALVLAALLVGSVLGVKAWLTDEPYVAPVEIVQAAPTVLKPFEADLQTCFGTVTTLFEMKATRENSIPIPILPDLGNTDDNYYITAPVSADLCLQGTYTSVTTPDAVTITISQQNDIVLHRPGIDATDLRIGGHQSNGSVIIGLLPFTSADDPDLVATALRAAQTQAQDPTCLSEAMRTPGLGLYDLILASLAQDALDQGIVQPVHLVLLDADGAPTSTWDARPQRARFEQEKARLNASLPDNYTVDLAATCDVSQWGIAGRTSDGIGAEGDPILGSAALPTMPPNPPLYPTPTGTTEPSIWTPNKEVTP